MARRRARRRGGARRAGAIDRSALRSETTLDGELGAQLATLRRLAARDDEAAGRCAAHVERWFARSEALRTTTARVRSYAPCSTKRRRRAR